MCEVKPSGKCPVDASVCDQYKAGGQSREQLEMALLECIARWGTNRSSYKKIKVGHLDDAGFLFDISTGTI